MKDPVDSLRASSKTSRRRSQSVGEGKENERAENVTGGHKMIIKTALNSEKCVVCDERIKFGKVSLRCSECKLVMQSECEDKMPLSCSPLSPTMVSNTPGGQGGLTPGGLGTPSKKRQRQQFFASPMLR